MAKQLSLGVNRIVIDPGHGGRDRGASGYLKGVYEKDVVLKIAKQLAKKMKAHNAELAKKAAQKAKYKSKGSLNDCFDLSGGAE